MDPRLIQLMQQLQQSRQPVRFDDGGEVGEDGEDLSWLFGGGNNYGDIDPGWFGGDVQDYSETVNPEDILGSEVINNLIGEDAGGDAGETVEMLTRGITPGGAGEDIKSVTDLIELLPDDMRAGIPVEPESEFNPRAEDTGYGALIPTEDLPSGLINPENVDDAVLRNMVNMQTASLDSENKFNAARDSQAANKYLEEVMGMPRSEIDAAYASQIPKFVNLSNFQGGKSFETATGREVKYDNKGNLVDAKTGQVVSKAPPGTTSKQISDILKQYTGGGTGGGAGTKTATSSNNMSWLLPLLLMMAAMNRGQQSTSGQAVIPKLSAERTTLPYQQVQQAPGYRPGQGGVRYVSDVSYKPMAQGGVASLNAMPLAKGGRLLHGPGDGVSDSIPAMIGNTQPARLARGEFVVDARTVSELGNGSTEAGAEKLYKMMERVHSARKKAGRGQDSHADKHLPA